MTRSAWSSHVLLLPAEEDGISAPSAVTPADLDECDVEVAQEAFLHHLRDVRQVHVQVVERPGVDLGAGHRVGLVGHAQVDPVHGRQRTVQLGGGGRTGPDADREAIPALGRIGGATDQRGRDCLRVAETGEPAHPDMVAWRDERRGLLSRHHLAGDGLAPDTRSVRHSRSPLRPAITVIRRPQRLSWPTAQRPTPSVRRQRTTARCTGRPGLLPAARPTAVPLRLPGAGRVQEDPGQRDLRPYRG